MSSLPMQGKTSKFRPAKSAHRTDEPARKALSTFSTPGFGNKQAPSQMTRQRSDVIDISSDDGPSNSSLKRDSSSYSILEDNPAPSSKRLRTEKVNILGTSTRVNQLSSTSGYTKDTPFDSLITSMMALLDPHEVGKLEPDDLNTRRVGDYDFESLLASTTSKFYSTGKGDPELFRLFMNITARRVAAIEAAINTKRAKENSPLTHQLPPAPTAPLAVMAPPAQSIPQISTTPSVQAPTTQSSRSFDSQQVASTSFAAQSFVEEPTFIDDEDQYGDWDFPMDALKDIDALNGPTATTPPLPQPTDSPTPNARSDLTTSPYYEEAKRCLSKFNLTDFRPNQLEAVISILEGRDVFVLMPTGGGKSLCYQLPSVCHISGRPPNSVTAVISPLIALMDDQVNALRQKGICAVSNEDNWRNLVQNSKEPLIWYITPEKLQANSSVLGLLKTLAANRRLRLFGIDEAHCISTWGQDFRDAYTTLGRLRSEVPTVPIMALTATADPRTAKDIVSQLHLKDDYVSLSSSFNRVNLIYSIRTKSKGFLDDIATYIQSNHRGQCGIVYCLARKKCEDVADVLRSKGLKADYYHAEADKAHKDTVMRDWQSGKLSIVVATIAFGMGVDKSDVRFVVHHDMPKTLTGYYQETGRAGRDGQPSHCVLYYSFADLQKFRTGITRDDKLTEQRKASQRDEVTKMYNFCENASICRRVQILEYFGQKDFDPRQCKRMCDNCQSTELAEEHDVTDCARKTISLLREILSVRDFKLARGYLEVLLRGSKRKDVLENKHHLSEYHGCCSHMSKDLLELFVNRLCAEEIISIYSVANGSRFHNDYLQIGPKATSRLDRSSRLVIWVKPKAGGTGKVTAPVSVTAPVKSRSKGKQRVGGEDDDPIDMYQEDDEASTYRPVSAPPVKAVASAPPAPAPRIVSMFATPAIPTVSTVKYPVSVGVPPAISRTKTAPATVTYSPPVPVASSSTTPAINNEPSAEGLYQKMIELRARLAREKHISENEIVDDETLQYLSVTSPRDYKSFESELATGMELLPGDPKVLNTWKNYGRAFLELCINHSIEASSCQAKPPHQVPMTPADLHQRFEYQAPAVSRTNSKAKKFRPAPPS